MATINVAGSNLGNALNDLLMADDIVPGDAPSYQLCKTLRLYHPLGEKLVELPIKLAMSQPREIAVPNAPEERVRDQFVKAWNAMGVDRAIFNGTTSARCYGISSIAVIVDGVDAKEPLDMSKFADKELAFNVIDPLNSAGSLVMIQDPNTLNYQKPGAISVNGIPYHHSRAITIMHGTPIFLAYTHSAFGYVGQSVFQRVLFAMKSFIQTMVTDDMVSRKAGLLIAFMKMPGSIIDGIMAAVAGIKRALLQQGVTNNVLSMGTDDRVESLNLTNIDGASKTARSNILENIASGAPMPAQMMNEESFAEGFGEGTEDAKKIAHYIDGVRIWMQPVYNFFDPIVMYKAWTPEFYATIQKDFPDEYGSVDYQTAFYQWKNAFVALWPSLLTEPDSEQIKTEDVKFKAIVAMIEVVGPMVDPDNKATLLQWAADNINENKLLFQSPLNLDWEALANYEPPQPMAEPSEPKPFAAADSDRIRRAIDRSDRAVTLLPDRKRIAAQ